jgi:tRNA threonylcarbamoyladenosine biosynthesis protein TsaB
MKILALDSAMTACSAAVRVDRVTIAHERLDLPRGQSEILLPLIERVRRAAGLAFADIDRFAVTVGPGHFTGLRAGLAAARGLALAAGRPLLGVTTLSAVAAGVPAAERAGALVVVALASKRAQPYVQAFDAGLQPLEAPAAADVPRYTAAWAATRRHPRVVVAGDAGADLAAALAARGVQVALSTAPPLPDAGVVAALAAAMPLPAGPPSPLYIHPVETTAPRPRSRPTSSGMDA